MAISSEVLTNAMKNLKDFKDQAMVEIMKKRELDADAIKNVGMLTLYIDTAVSNINGAQTLCGSLLAEPADEMPMETATKKN